MNNEDLQQLKTLAIKASPGPWCHSGDEYTDQGGEYQGIESPTEIIVGQFGVTKNNAKYIAASNPAAILSLIERIESLAAPAVANAAPELPPLPETEESVLLGGRIVSVWLEDKMHAYGQACHAIGRGAAVHEYIANGTFKSGVIADQAPQATLTDERIKEIANEWAMATHGYVNDPFGYCIDFARAIEASAAPNAALVEALRETLRQAEGWYDECRGGDASDFEWHKEAVAALAAAGVKP